MEVKTMATESQVNANQQNARKSTGPRTPQGKATVSQNAVTHGLFSSRPILSTEDPEQYDRLYEDYIRLYAPQGALEEFLADQAVNGLWRLRRARGFEILTLNKMLHEARSIGDTTGGLPESVLMAAVIEEDLAKNNLIERLQKYETKIERGLCRTQKELRITQALRRKQDEGKQGLVRSDESQVVPGPAFPGQDQNDSAKTQNKPNSPITDSKSKVEERKTKILDHAELLEKAKMGQLGIDPLTKLMMKDFNKRQLNKKVR
jgi:hypothetical protein